jgi:hypothetical protein
MITPIVIAVLFTPLGLFLFYRDLSSGTAWVPRTKRFVRRADTPVAFWLVQVINLMILLGGVFAGLHLLGFT